MIDVAIVTLATFGISALVSNYDGPFSLFKRLQSVRELPFHCTVCTSCWVAIPLAYATNLGVLGYFCVIGGVILIERLT